MGQDISIRTGIIFQNKINFDLNNQETNYFKYNIDYIVHSSYYLRDDVKCEIISREIDNKENNKKMNIEKFHIGLLNVCLQENFSESHFENIINFVEVLIFTIPYNIYVEKQTEIIVNIFIKFERNNDLQKFVFNFRDGSLNILQNYFPINKDKEIQFLIHINNIHKSEKLYSNIKTKDNELKNEFSCNERNRINDKFFNYNKIYSNKDNQLESKNFNKNELKNYLNSYQNKSYNKGFLLNDLDLEEISKYNKLSVVSNFHQNLIGFFYDEFDYLDEANLVNFFLIGLNQELKEKEIKIFFEFEKKFKVKDMINNPFEEKTILRLVLENTPELVQSDLGNSKHSCKIGIKKYNLMILKIKTKNKLNPEDLYIKYQIMINLEREIKNYQHLFKFLQEQIGEIFEMKFLEELEAVITFYNKNSRQICLSFINGLEYSADNLKLQNENKNIITFKECINATPISGNKIDIVFKKLNLLEKTEATNLPKRPPIKYQTKNDYLPSIKYLLKSNSMWEHFQLLVNKWQIIKIEDFINDYKTEKISFIKKKNDIKSIKSEEKLREKIKNITNNHNTFINLIEDEDKKPTIIINNFSNENNDNFISRKRNISDSTNDEYNLNNSEEEIVININKNYDLLDEIKYDSKDLKHNKNILQNELDDNYLEYDINSIY